MHMYFDASGIVDLNITALGEGCLCILSIWVAPHRVKRAFRRPFLEKILCTISWLQDSLLLGLPEAQDWVALHLSHALVGYSIETTATKEPRRLVVATVLVSLLDGVPEIVASKLAADFGLFGHNKLLGTCKQ